MRYRKDITAVCIGLISLALFPSQTKAQFDLPTWHDIERAVRPQDLPPHFSTPAETATYFDDPQYMESHYRIGFRNRTDHPIQIELHALKDGRWVTTGDKYWMIKPHHETWLLYHDKQAVLANRFRFRGVARDGSNLTWGDLGNELNVGQPYSTNGGTYIYWENLNP